VFLRVLYIIVCPFVLFLLVVVLSVFLRVLYIIVCPFVDNTTTRRNKTNGQTMINKTRRNPDNTTTRRNRTNGQTMIYKTRRNRDNTTSRRKTRTIVCVSPSFVYHCLSVCSVSSSCCIVCVSPSFVYHCLSVCFVSSSRCIVCVSPSFVFRETQTIQRLEEKHGQTMIYKTRRNRQYND
jgi:hypothetical protein